MRRLDPAAIDLNLLRPLAALLAERHVTNAAARCGMSQPAMSRAFERLRVVLADELLVRRDGFYELTPRAEKLRIELDQLLPQIDVAIRGDAFDPAATRERFRVVTHEYGSAVLMPAIVRAVTAAAPNAVVDVELWHAPPLAQVEAGAADLAIAGLDGTSELQLEPLLSDDVVCIVARDHPLRDPSCSLATYVSYPHVAIAVENGRQPWFDRPLREHALARRIAYRTPSLIAAALALPGTEMILTTGRRWFDAVAGALPLRALDAPVEFDAFRYGMAWHSRLAYHPAHAWFRGLVAHAAREIATPASAARSAT